MYVSVKGGESAINNAHQLLAKRRRGDESVPAITLSQIQEQMTLAVDRVMVEGALYDRELAALAIKQARGDTVEAIFLLRAYRTTLPRFGSSHTLDVVGMVVERRVSAIFKNMPGGQVLGPTFDYTHRLLDFGLHDEEGAKVNESLAPERSSQLSSIDQSSGVTLPNAVDALLREGLLESPNGEDKATPPGDITRQPLRHPAKRDVRLQALARGDEGFLLGLAYSTQRGYGRNHPFAGEVRYGRVSVVMTPDELGFPITIGVIAVTECQMVNQFKGSKTKIPKFTSGYGIAFGHSERKTISMALLDRAMRTRDLGEDVIAPAQDPEFVLMHSDNVEAAGFINHLKLPHYADFQSELNLLRDLQREFTEAHSEAANEDRQA